MYCRKCGSKIADGAVFCPNCGAKQTASAAPENAGGASSGGSFSGMPGTAGGGMHTSATGGFAVGTYNFSAVILIALNVLTAIMFLLGWITVGLSSVNQTFSLFDISSLLSTLEQEVEEVPSVGWIVPLVLIISFCAIAAQIVLIIMKNHENARKGLSIVVPIVIIIILIVYNYCKSALLSEMGGSGSLNSLANFGSSLMSMMVKLTPAPIFGLIFSLANAVLNFSRFADPITHSAGHFSRPNTYRTYTPPVNPTPTSYTPPVNPTPASYTPPVNPNPTPVTYRPPVNPNPASASYTPPVNPNPAPASYTPPVNPAPASYTPPVNPAPASYTAPVNPDPASTGGGLKGQMAGSTPVNPGAQSSSAPDDEFFHSADSL